MNGPYWNSGFDFIKPKTEQERRDVGIMPWDTDYTTVSYGDDWVIIEVLLPHNSIVTVGDRRKVYRTRILDENDIPIHHGDFYRYEDALAKVKEHIITPNVKSIDCLAYYEYDSHSEWELINLKNN